MIIPKEVDVNQTGRPRQLQANFTMALSRLLVADKMMGDAKTPFRHDRTCGIAVLSRDRYTSLCI
jgi:hypothetical protein